MAARPGSIMGIPAETHGESLRDRLVVAGLDLFYRNGFHAVSLDQIIRAVRTTKTSFYNHFESKEALAAACISHRDQRWRERFPRLLQERGGDDPLAQLRAVFEVWRAWFSDVQFNGCLFIHACSEFPSMHHPCHIAARDNVLALRDIIADLADHAGLADPDAFADRYSLLMQGAIITEVIHRQNTAASTAAEIAEALIERATPLPS